LRFVAVHLNSSYTDTTFGEFISTNPVSVNHLSSICPMAEFGRKTCTCQRDHSTTSLAWRQLSHASSSSEDGRGRIDLHCHRVCL